MRIKFILGVALSALLLASTTELASSQASNQLAATAAVTAPSQAQPDQATERAAQSRLAWYADPIVLAFALAALFAAIDIAVLLSKHTHTHRRRHA